MKNQNQIIEEIHNSFYSEGDILLAEAQRQLDSGFDEAKIEKAERLKKLGFAIARDAKEGFEVKKEKEMNEVLKNLILKYKQKYPLYKFIDEVGVKRICQKYNLIQGGVEKYIGAVPDKNINEIENFKIDDEDKQYERFVMSMFGIGSSRMSSTYDEFLNNDRRYSSVLMGTVRETPLAICAPMHDFDLTAMEVKDGKLLAIHIPDPVVLQPVNGGYLIVTAWGIEAKDDDVINPKMN